MSNLSILCWTLLTGIAASQPTEVATEVALVDISALFRPDAALQDMEACAAAIDAQLSSVGAFVAVGSPVQEAASMRAAGRLFSADPAKLMHAKIPQGGFMRGYLPFGQESGLQTHFEPKEGFSYGYSWDGSSALNKENALQGDNVWPDLDDMSVRETLQQLFTTEISVAEKLTESISMVLNNGNRSALSSYVDPHGSTSIMRLFHYFATDLLKTSHGIDIDETEKTVMGSSPHTDWGYLTLILQDDVGGLQLRHSNGQWVDVPYVPNSLVVNAGDFLAALSGGHYRSPVHRVLSPAARDRTSFVLFYYPRFETPMDASLFTRTAEVVSGGGAEPTSNGYLHGGAAGAAGDDEIHNSLFRLAGSNSVGTEDASTVKKNFGDYIIEKWREVKAY